VLVPSLAAAMALTVLVSLGVWQLDRKAWKEGLIATLEQRLSAPPVALPPPAEWPGSTAAGDEFLRVSMTAEFLIDREALVYTGGSTCAKLPAARVIGCSRRRASRAVRSSW